MEHNEHQQSSNDMIRWVQGQKDAACSKLKVLVIRDQLFATIQISLACLNLNKIQVNHPLPAPRRTDVFVAI